MIRAGSAETTRRPRLIHRRSSIAISVPAIVWGDVDHHGLGHPLSPASHSPLTFKPAIPKSVHPRDESQMLCCQAVTPGRSLCWNTWQCLPCKKMISLSCLKICSKENNFWLGVFCQCEDLMLPFGSVCASIRVTSTYWPGLK